MKAFEGFKSVMQTALFAAAATLWAVPAHAQLTQSGSSLLQSEQLRFGNNAAANVNTGAFQVQQGSGSPFWVYCLDPLDGFNNSPNTTSTMSLFSFLNGGTYTAEFAQAGYAGAVAGGYTTQNTTTVLNKLVDLYSHAYNDSLTSTVKAAAFQYAIWEIIGDSGYSGTTGGLVYGSGNADTTFKTQANSYLSAISGGATTWASLGLSTAATFTYTVYTSNPEAASQNLLTVTSSTVTNTGAPVPEPGSLALAMAALLGLAFTRQSGSRG